MMTINIGSLGNPGEDSRPALRLHEFGDGTYALQAHDAVTQGLLVEIKDLLASLLASQLDVSATLGTVDGKRIMKTATVAGTIL